MELTADIQQESKTNNTMKAWRQQPLSSQIILVVFIILNVILFGLCTTKVNNEKIAVPKEKNNETTTTMAANECPTGSLKDDHSGQCIEICNSANSKSPNGPCIARTNNTYNVVLSANYDPNKTYDEPLISLMLPSCKNTTLNEGEFQMLPNKTTITVLVGNYPIDIEPMSISADNKTANICYPLSPQLLQCTLKKLHPSLYDRLPKRILLNRKTGNKTDFRDYYITNTNEYIGCIEELNINRKLRCNYIVYQKNEYKFKNNNTIIWLGPSKTQIYKPEYTLLDKDSIKLCYPFTLTMTNCKLWLLESHEFEVQDDKTMKSFTHGVTYNMGEYLLTATNSSAKMKAGVCVRAPSVDRARKGLMVITCIQIISAISLFVTFIIHLLIPRLNHHAKPLLCHMFSMVVMYTSLSFRSLMERIEPDVCYVIFIFLYFSAMASFFWLNVLAFDLWSIFANLQTTSTFWCSCSSSGTKSRRFYYYSLYAWGVPLLFTAASITLDTQESLQEVFQMKPTFKNMCWFNERKSAFMLLYGPLFCVLGINLLLFILTIYNLHHASKGVEVVNKEFNKQL